MSVCFDEIQVGNHDSFVFFWAWLSLVLGSCSFESKRKEKEDRCAVVREEKQEEISVSTEVDSLDIVLWVSEASFYLVASWICLFLWRPVSRKKALFADGGIRDWHKEECDKAGLNQSEHEHLRLCCLGCFARVVCCSGAPAFGMFP